METKPEPLSRGNAQACILLSRKLFERVDDSLPLLSFFSRFPVHANDLGNCNLVNNLIKISTI
jgi:hypothetical protein